MAVKLQVDKDGNLVFNNTKIKIEDIVRIKDSILVDGYDNPIDLATLIGDTTSEADIAQRALLANDTLAVGGVESALVLNKFNYKDYVPFTDTPVVTIADSVNAGSTLIGTVDNFDPDNFYLLSSSIGDMVLNNGTLSVTSVESDTDYTINITVIAIGKGMIRSIASEKQITVYGTTLTSDQALINGSYETNESTNDGFEY